jgi:acyl-coenzyme A thioesterase PaaI-like protein
MHARFTRPVYDGDVVRVLPVDQSDDGGVRRARLELRDSAGEVCATAEATMPATPVPPPALTRWPDVAPVTERPPASPESLAPGTAFGLALHGFHAEHAGAYLDDVRETAALYRGAGVAHPGWLLRDANYVLSGNVRLGPWIHVESRVQHHRAVRDGDGVSARALVTREWEHKGHRFVELDVATVASGDVAAQITHTAIYAPRVAR